MERQEFICDVEGLNLVVSSSGALEYTFAEPTTGAFLRRGAEDGYGLYATSARPKIEETPLAVWISGQQSREHICFGCFRIIVGGKVKQMEGMAGLSFCTVQCMAASQHVLDTCGKCLALLVEEERINKCNKDLQCLALLCIAAALEDRKARTVLNLVYSHSFTSSRPELGLDKLSAELEDLVKNLGSAAFFEFLTKDLGGIQFLCRLLNILAHNAQSIPFLRLAKTGLLVLLPTLSMINHSCRPNTVMTRGTGGDGLTVMVHPLRDLVRGEQLTISYLSNLCCPREERWRLLSEAFLIDRCKCARCSTATSERLDDTLLNLHKAVQSADNVEIWRATSAYAQRMRSMDVSLKGSASSVTLILRGIHALSQCTTTSCDDSTLALELLDEIREAIEDMWSGDSSSSEMRTLVSTLSSAFIRPN